MSGSEHAGIQVSATLSAMALPNLPFRPSRSGGYPVTIRWATATVCSALACGTPSDGPATAVPPLSTASNSTNSTADGSANSSSTPRPQIVSEPTPHGWTPDLTPSATFGGCDAAPVSLDTLASAISSDLQQLDPVSRPYVRYVSLAHQEALGPCAIDRVTAPGAVHVLLNSLSSSVRIHHFESLATIPNVYRVDLRDLGWDTPLHVEGVDFSNAWDALNSNRQFPFDWSPQALSDLEPWADDPSLLVLRVEEVAYLAATGPWYSALLQIPEKVEDWRADLEVNALENFEYEDIARAGKATEGGYLLAERQSMGIRNGAVWQMYELPETDDPSALAPWFGRDHVALQSDYNAPVSVLYTLPNGFFAAARFDAEGQRVDRLSAPGRPFQNGFGCLSCHQAGPLPLVDEVVESSIGTWYFPGINPLRKNAPRTSEVIQRWYPQAHAFEAIVRNDQVAFSFAFSGLEYTVADAPAVLRTLFSQYPLPPEN